MSADNAVFVLRCGSVYRVQAAGMPLIENIEYKFNRGLINKKEKNYEIVRSFARAPAFTSMDKVYEYIEAKRFCTEYGVIFLKVNT